MNEHRCTKKTNYSKEHARKQPGCSAEGTFAGRKSQAV